MGIHIRLNILPHQITESDWLSTYKEAEKLIEAYPFMDLTRDRKAYNSNWIYTDKPSERAIEHTGDNVGYDMIGDLVTMQSGENFTLIKDLNYYRDRDKKKPNELDILQYQDLGYNTAAVVFNSKTQGYDYHLYILAIACLIEDRLKPYAIVTGDISRSQMEDAIKWANSILKTPIQITERTNNARLLARIRSFQQDELLSLELFLHNTLNKLDINLGEFIKKEFKAESIKGYYQQELKIYNIGTYGFSGRIEDYLNLAFDFSTLCDLITERKPSKNDVISFIDTVFEMNLHLTSDDLEKINKLQLTKLLNFNDPDSKEPETIGSSFGKFFALLKTGGVRQTKAYLPIDRLNKILLDKFASYIDVESAIKKHISKVDQIHEIKQEDQEIAPIKKKTKEKEYDIYTLEELILWQPNDTIRPNLEKFILRLKDFLSGELPESLEVKSRKLEDASIAEKMRYLTEENRFYFTTKKSWQWIERGIEDQDFFYKVARIFLVDSNELNTYRLILTLLNNKDLFNKYILSETKTLT